MKKPSGKQSTNDPPLPFDSPFEPAPLALLSPSPPKQEQPEGEREVENFSSPSANTSPKKVKRPEALTYRGARQEVFDRQRLRHLTAPGLRDYLTKNPKVLKSRISEEERHVLQDERFWETLKDPMQRRWLMKEMLWSLDSLSYGLVLEQLPAGKLSPEIYDHPPQYNSYNPNHISPLGPESEGFWFQTIVQAAFQDPDGSFGKAFATKYEKEPPQEWEQVARKILDLMSDIWRSVRDAYVYESTYYHLRWEQGQTDALSSAVWRGLIQEEWVGRAISELQRQQVAGDMKRDKDKATEILKQIGKALWSVQSGIHKKLTKQQEKAIVDDCDKHRPIYRSINAEFKKKREARLLNNTVFL